MITAMLIVTVIPILTDTAKAGRPIFSANTLVNTDQVSHDQVPGDILTDLEGRIYVLYQSKTNFVNWDVFITHSDNNGRTWSESCRVDDNLRDDNESNDDTDQESPSMAIAPNGTIYAVWEDARFVPSQIRVAWSEDGENFTRSRRIDPRKVNDDPKKEQPNWHAHRPDIAVDSSGNLFVAWEDRYLEGSYRNVWGSRSEDGGATWSEAKLVNADRRVHEEHRDHDFVRVAMHGDHVYVTWHDGRDSVYGVKPYLAISSNGGLNFSEEKQLSDDTQFNSRTRAVPTVDGVGNLYVAWTDKRAGPDEIWYIRSEDHGETISPNARLVAAPEEYVDVNPYINATGDGIVSIVWQRIPPGLDDGEIYFRNSSDGGRSWDDIMRVDDTERYGSDATTQHEPIMCYDNGGRPLVVWSDERNYNSQRTDVYFSRHSGVNDLYNSPPEILSPLFFGEFLDFNPRIGSALSNFTFEFVYRDEDNDMPLPGYPRVHVFRDMAGTEPVFGEGLVMEQVYPGDIDFMDGNLYRLVTNISDVGRHYWRLEVRGERDTGSVFSSIMEGPWIDATPPSIVILSPPQEMWNSSSTITVRARVHDMEGGGINVTSIRYRKSTTGPDNYGGFVPVNGRIRIDNDTYEVVADIYMDEGVDNWVQFGAKDRVGNGPSLSEPLNLWVDTKEPYYFDIDPTPTDIQLYTDVNCSIRWMDHLPGSNVSDKTGVVPSTIEYCYRTTSDPLSEWSSPDGITEVAEGEFVAWVNLEFADKGVYNYIKWRAVDALGNEKTTGEINVKVQVPENYPPVFVGEIYPKSIVVNSKSPLSEYPHFHWDPAFDEENDELYYSVMLMDHPSRLFRFTSAISVGRNTFFDLPLDKRGLTPGFYVIEVNVTDRIGGFDTEELVFRVLDKGTPPPTSVPEFGPFYLSDANTSISWERSPSEGEMEITYMIRLGTDTLGGDIMDWTARGMNRSLIPWEMGVSKGIYSLQVLCESGGNRSRVTEGMIKIAQYDVEINVPEKHDAYRGKGSSKSKPLVVQLMGLGDYSDNVTVIVEGELVNLGFAFMAQSSTDTAYYSLETQKGLQEREWSDVTVAVFPDEDTPTGDYTIRLHVFSEDGKTDYYSKEIIVKVGDAPSSGGEEGLTDDLYRMVTDILPFLSFIPKNLMLPLLLFLLLIIVIAIALIGILIYRGSKGTDRSDPYAEQKRLYRELYGVEPTMEQLEGMSVEEEILGTSPSQPERSMDESFFISENTGRSIPEE